MVAPRMQKREGRRAAEMKKKDASHVFTGRVKDLINVSAGTLNTSESTRLRGGSLKFIELRQWTGSGVICRVKEFLR